MLILISSLIWFSRARLTVWCPGLMYVLFIVLFSDPVQAQQQFGKIFQKNLNKVSSADTIQNKRSLLNNINKQSSSMSLDPTGSNLSGKIVRPAETVADAHTDRNQYKGSYHDTTKQNGSKRVGSDTLFKILGKTHRSESRFGGSDPEPLDLAIPLPSRYRMSMDSLIINDRILYRFNGENPYTGVVVDLWDN